ncbi:MAG TPA: shikimate kinase [Thermoanaerobaculia bacterium]|jgi:shikimate kinase
MRIYLTGFMGAGKTAVGGNLSGLLGSALLDLDHEVEARAGLSIREIFERLGEGAFRELEHDCLKQTARFQAAVVATGGGTMTFPRNLALIRRLGVSVWLNPSFATIVERIGGRGKSDRPLFKTEEQALALFRERLPAYRRSDLQMDVAPGETAAEVAARIALRLKERRCVI